MILRISRLKFQAIKVDHVLAKNDFPLTDLLLKLVCHIVSNATLLNVRF